MLFYCCMHGRSTCPDTLPAAVIHYFGCFGSGPGSTSSPICSDCLRSVYIEGRRAEPEVYSKFQDVIRFELGSEGWIALECALLTIAALRKEAE